ncbi:MAG: histidine phosphatase family protein [Chloroflexota bacterium]|nr:histidine phosphatase family protein [Chloroflexota bacterium]
MSVRRIIFFRPGETNWNREGRWQGWVAAPLNEQGRHQTEALAKYVRNIGMTALYTSDLRRAIQTADMLAQPLGFAPTPDARLRERSIGSWQGLTLEEMELWYPDDYATMLTNIDEYRIPGGESRNDVRVRVMAALDEIMASASHETIGILSHTTAIKIMLAALVPSYDPLYVELDNTSVTTIHRRDDQWMIAAVNDRMHLDGLDAGSVREIESKKS